MALTPALRQITPFMRDVLIDHIDGGRVPFSVQDQLRERSTRALLLRGLLKFDQVGPPIRVKYTLLTPAGRRALGALLADYADALARASGLLEHEAGEVAKPEDFLEAAQLRLEQGALNAGDRKLLGDNLRG